MNIMTLEYHDSRSSLKVHAVNARSYRSLPNVSERAFPRRVFSKLRVCQLQIEEMFLS
ncbi:hypothetical protein [Tardiphaga sp. 839_C3_N1_4]|uniref:hypothetical protein n=1 Tax=Tardiphaga sp. 839_C3_N1_4 TaxID=3240761 RepID=UPI003F21D4A1